MFSLLKIYKQTSSYPGQICLNIQAGILRLENFGPLFKENLLNRKCQVHFFLNYFLPIINLVTLTYCDWTMVVHLHIIQEQSANQWIGNCGLVYLLATSPNDPLVLFSFCGALEKIRFMLNQFIATNCAKKFEMHLHIYQEEHPISSKQRKTNNKLLYC